jgi:transcriptional regulator with XRE-family HTH domain
MTAAGPGGELGEQVERAACGEAADHEAVEGSGCHVGVDVDLAPVRSPPSRRLTGIRSDTYLIGYTRRMMDAAELLEHARVSSGLTQEELARRAGTSRPTLSAYEHRRKSPTVATFARLLAQAGWDLDAQPHVSFTSQTSAHGKPSWIPDRLPRLDVAHALAVVELPLHLNWSAPGRIFDLRSRADRARVYEIVLREGTPADFLAYVDGALLVDLWEDLVLPRALRSAWAPLISMSSGAGA